MLGWVLRFDWGGNFFLREGVEQSGEEAAFAFHHRSAVTALATAQAGIEQVAHGIAEHVETKNHHRQADPGPHCQPRRQASLELRAVDAAAATRRFNHSEQEDVDGIARYEAHLEKHQDGDQEKGRDQQQDPPDDVRSHLISVGETSRPAAPEGARTGRS